MKFRVDWMSQIGQSHVADCKPCQDYCFGWPESDPGGIQIGGESSAFAVVSDGCSTGGRTDIGSRIMACRLSREVTLYSELASDLSPRGILQQAMEDVWKSATEQCLGLLGLSPRDAYATCVSCYTDARGASASIHGDGAVMVVYHDGSLKIVKSDWSSGKLRNGAPFNPPFYPVYASRACRNDGTYKSFLDAYSGTPEPLIVETLTCTGDNITTSESKLTLEKAMEGLYIEIGQEELNQVKLIALFSDGINQVSGLEMMEVAKECVAFKNFEGAFVKRRIRSAVKNWAKNDHKPMDDISCAVILPIQIEQKEIT